MTSTYTKYTKETFKDFASFHVNKRTKLMPIIYACAVIILVCSVIMFCLEDIFYGVLYLVLGLFFALYGVFLKFVILLSNKKNFNSTDAFVFDDNQFTITSTDALGNQRCVSTVSYSALYDVFLYKDYAFIYVNKISCFILLKKNFESEEEFNLLIENIKKQLPEKKPQKVISKQN